MPPDQMARGGPCQEAAPDNANSLLPTLPDAADIATALAEADRIVRRSAASAAWCRWHGETQYARGWLDGHAAAEAGMAAAWHAVADPAAAGGSSFAELEERRGGAGGRGRAGDPRPGDYPGLGGS